MIGDYEEIDGTAISWRGENWDTKNKKKLVHCHFAYSTFHLNSSGLDPGPSAAKH